MKLAVNFSIDVTKLDKERFYQAPLSCKQQAAYTWITDVEAAYAHTCILAAPLAFDVGCQSCFTS